LSGVRAELEQLAERNFDVLDDVVKNVVQTEAGTER
jgi:hypothetical protein